MSDYRDYGYDTRGPMCAHKYLLPAIKTLLGAPAGPILDLGCGNGALALELSRLGHDVYGIDASESGISIAAAQMSGRFYLCDFARNELPPELAKNKYAVVISTEVIEHLYDPRALLRFARSNLAPDGRLIISTPYHGYLKNVLLAVSAKLDNHFTALWDGGHIKFFSRRTLEIMLRQEGFTITRFCGAGGIPLIWRAMLVEAHLNVN